MNPPDISLILPVFNEKECISAVLREAHSVLLKTERSFEILAVDDGSSDGTDDILRSLRRDLPELRVLRLTPNSGQSAAMGAGFRHARGRILVTMDADGQNDPADIPRLVEQLTVCDVCCGYRVNRKDTFSKVWASRIANRIRNSVLHEDIIDTGCSLKAFKTEFVSDLPMFKGMHRFLATLTRLKGATVAQLAVNHRPRSAGQSKYTNLRRLRDTMADLRAVRWMQSRNTPCRVEELE